VGRASGHCPNLDPDLDVVLVVERSTQRWSRSKARSRWRAPSFETCLIC